MANQLKMAVKNAIFVLKSQHLSNREIAQQLGLSRNTVNRYIRGGPSNDSNCAKAPPGSKPDKSIPNRTTTSQCRPFHEPIMAKLQQEFSAKRIHQVWSPSMALTAAITASDAMSTGFSAGVPCRFDDLSRLPARMPRSILASAHRLSQSMASAVEPMCSVLC